jgi:hypothetical protein
VNKGRSGGRWQCEATHGVTAESTGKEESGRGWGGAVTGQAKLFCAD